MVPALCARAQLGNGSAQVEVPDSQGRVYGSFTVLNTSGISCKVSNGGQITVTGGPGTDAAKVRVVEVWESQQHIDEFFRSKLGPAFEKLGVEIDPPELTETFWIERS